MACFVAWRAGGVALLALAGCGDTFGSEAGNGGAAPGGGGQGAASSTSVASGGGGAGQGGAGATGGSAGAAGEGGAPDPATSGCADGHREAYLGQANIAACAGGFRVPGSAAQLMIVPQCNRQAGNTGMFPNGENCTIEDLCAEGWHVCVSVAEVVNKGGTTCPSEQPDPTGAFWLTRVTTDGQANCQTTGTNNVIGCAYQFGEGAGGPVPGTGCAPLNFLMWYEVCGVDPYWDCPLSGQGEAANVTKNGPQAGGVLCCRDRATM